MFEKQYFRGLISNLIWLFVLFMVYIGLALLYIFPIHVLSLQLASLYVIYFLFIVVVFVFLTVMLIKQKIQVFKYLPIRRRLKLTDQTLVEASLCQAASNFMRRIKRGNPGYDQANELIKKIYIAIRMDYTTESINSVIKKVDNSLFCCVDETFPNEPKIRLYYLAKSKYPLDDFYIKLCELPKK